MVQVCLGDQVEIRYTGVASDGTVFGTGDGGETLQFNVDSQQAIDGLRLAVLGMKAGEKKTVSVPPEQGFGPRRPERVYQLSRKSLPDHVQIGDRLSGLSGEQVIPVWVVALDDDFATMDANHPLAGQSLLLQIELVAIQPRGGSPAAAKAATNRTPRPIPTAVRPAGRHAIRGRANGVFRRKR
jgi:peptidylprolyl isomerase